MRREKAQAILNEYKDTGFKAGRALRNVGYAESTSKKKPSVIIDRAIKTVARDIADTPTGELSKSGRRLLAKELLGLTDSDVADFFRSIVTQEKDWATKLKAVAVLMGEMGVDISGTKEDKTQPMLSIKVDKIETTTRLDNTNGQTAKEVVLSDLSHKVECTTKEGEGDIGREKMEA